MGDPLGEQCTAVADTLSGLTEGERTAEVLRFLSQCMEDGRAVGAIVLGILLRDRRDFDGAEYVFRLARAIPAVRHGAAFELAVAESVQGRPDNAAVLLQELEAEIPLNAYQHRVYAHQLGRLGDGLGADEHLARSVELEPGSAGECQELREFFAYLQRFPAENAQARRQALLQRHSFLHPEDIVAEARRALAERRGYSMIRLNDGEGSILHLSDEDEADFPALYARNRREFHRIWFGHEDFVRDPAFVAVAKSLDGIILRTDAVAGFVNHGLEGEYAWGSLRNVPSLFNIVRKLEQLARSPGGECIRLADPSVNQFLMLSGELERLLSEQSRLGLVSCHAALPEALRSRFGLAEVIFHQTPGEPSATGRIAPEPFGVWHARLMAELAAVRPGVLYLVAAGIGGKAFCDRIKQGGGVALDIGSVADVWMNAPTRAFSPELKRHALTEPAA